MYFNPHFHLQEMQYQNLFHSFFDLKITKLHLHLYIILIFSDFVKKKNLQYFYFKSISNFFYRICSSFQYSIISCFFLFISDQTPKALNFFLISACYYSNLPFVDFSSITASKLFIPPPYMTSS